MDENAWRLTNELGVEIGLLDKFLTRMNSQRPRQRNISPKSASYLKRLLHLPVGLKSVSIPCFRISSSGAQEGVVVVQSRTTAEP